jgi:DnaJ domain
MNCFQKSCNILKIVNNEDELSESILKKHYHKLCLLYHPDKLKNTSPSTKFLEVNDAYNYLSKYMGYADDDDYSDIETDNQEDVWTESPLLKSVGNFILIQTKYILLNEYVSNYVDSISNDSKLKRVIVLLRTHLQ